MNWNQYETIRQLQNYWKSHYKDNLEKTSKRPFYNPYPYKPSKELLKRLRDELKNITITKTDK